MKALLPKHARYVVPKSNTFFVMGCYQNAINIGTHS